MNENKAGAEVLPVFGWACAEERFGRHIVRLSPQKIEGGLEMVLKKDAASLIAELQRELAEAKRDAERLDWLAADPDRDVSYYRGSEYWRASDANRMLGRGDTLRAAIDAALAAGGP